MFQKICSINISILLFISMPILDVETTSCTKTIHLLLFIYRKQTFICVRICFITVNIVSLTPIWPSFACKERSRITFALCNNIQYHQKINNTIRGWFRGGVEGVATPPLRSICLFFCFQDYSYNNKDKCFFSEFDSPPPFDCLSSYEKIMYISRLLCTVLLARSSF